MAKEIVVFDLNDPTSTAKTVFVDIGTLIKKGVGGEEEWLLKFYTYSHKNNITRESVKAVYLHELSSGWYKSSGLTNNNYSIDSSCDMLNIKIDGSQGTYTITLDHGDNLTGKVVSKDIENKINKIPEEVEWLENDNNLIFGYTNCRVKYTDDKFYILSGSSGYYSGNKKSSVSVTTVVGNTAYELLGFNLGTNSEDLDSIIINEASLLTNYVIDTEDIIIDNDIIPALVESVIYQSSQ